MKIVIQSSSVAFTLRNEVLYLRFSLVDRQDDVLKDLFSERHSPYNWSGRELHECWLGWQHPSQKEQIERVVSKRYHRLQSIKLVLRYVNVMYVPFFLESIPLMPSIPRSPKISICCGEVDNPS